MKREEVKTIIFRYIFGYYNTQRINSFNEGGLPPVALRFFNNESRTRYSSRSNTRWDVTGFTGIMIVSGDFSDFLPLMRISEIIGVGKLCVMGHGKIRISALI